MLRDWIADNPVPRVLTNSRGKNGTVWRTLETGIRTDLWFDVMEMFMEAPAFDAQAKYEMTRSLVEQARHLHRYTVAFRHGNWQVVECTGLACAGIMLPEFRESAGWRERAFSYLAQHMERDVYPDGAHYELTPGYHGWVMERFLKASLLASAKRVQGARPDGPPREDVRIPDAREPAQPAHALFGRRGRRGGDCREHGAWCVALRPRGHALPGR